MCSVQFSFRAPFCSNPDSRKQQSGSNGYGLHPILERLFHVTCSCTFAISVGNDVLPSFSECKASPKTFFENHIRSADHSKIPYPAPISSSLFCMNYTFPIPYYALFPPCVQRSFISCSPSNSRDRNVCCTLATFYTMLQR